MKLKNYIYVGLSAFTFVALSGCSDSNSNSSMETSTRSYELVLSNLSANQPLSPLSGIIHGASYSAWAIGTAASVGLEMLAESGNDIEFLAESNVAGAYQTKSGGAVVLPGESSMLEIESTFHADMSLSLASMLVNTNDAFTGVNNIGLVDMELGDSMTLVLPVYDAGTEGNNELTGTIPGPADGGEGFNATRDDVNVVARHPGVVSSMDGNANSTLDTSHRFDGQIAKLVLTRTL